MYFKILDCRVRSCSMLCYDGVLFNFVRLEAEEVYERLEVALSAGVL